jgi:hypothetical protein
MLGCLVALASFPVFCGATDPWPQSLGSAEAKAGELLLQGKLSETVGQRPRAAAVVAAAPASCPDAKELEVAFQLAKGSGEPMRFSYDGCREEGRNDYLPPYTERYYKGPDGYGLVIVTDEGETSSDVLLSLGQDWAGRYGKLDNARLVSGEKIVVGEGKDQAVLSAVPDFSRLQGCEAALTQSSAYGSTVVRDAAGKPYLGFTAAQYDESSTVVESLVLLTDDAAYYYSESCDICADIDRCDLKTHRVTSVVHAHSAGCVDLAAYAKGIVAYDACQQPVAP